jgi:hypothetical protein
MPTSAALKRTLTSREICPAPAWSRGRAPRSMVRVECVITTNHISLDISRRLRFKQPAITTEGNLRVDFLAVTALLAN